MKNKFSQITYVVISFMLFVLTVNAQTERCVIIGSDQIKIPYSKDGVVIQFFYSKAGEFKYNESDYRPPTFISQIVYGNWQEVINDFPSPSEFDDNSTALVKFDWRKLGSLGEHQNWKTIVNNFDQKTYIGNYLDMEKNYDADKVALLKIIGQSFLPNCSPSKTFFYVKVYLADKQTMKNLGKLFPEEKAKAKWKEKIHDDKIVLEADY